MWIANIKNARFTINLQKISYYSSQQVYSCVKHCHLYYFNTLDKGDKKIVQVVVRGNKVEQALRALKKKMQREGLFREMKLRRAYEKPSEKKARVHAETIRRYRKTMRKRLEQSEY